MSKDTKVLLLIIGYFLMVMGGIMTLVRIFSLFVILMRISNKTLSYSGVSIPVLAIMLAISLLLFFGGRKLVKMAKKEDSQPVS